MNDSPETTPTPKKFVITLTEDQLADLFFHYDTTNWIALVESPQPQGVDEQSFNFDDAEVEALEKDARSLCDDLGLDYSNVEFLVNSFIKFLDG